MSAPVSGVDAAAVNRLIEALEEHDDVKEVYSNAEFSE
jgi:transcriptional/translational regulatory protein YebC/TACO1